MKERSTWRLAAGLALMVAVGGTWGCAQEVEDIDRTQADKINKDLFETDDEWYLQQTVINTGMEGANIGDGSMDQQAMMAFPMMESDLKRIRWTVTEDVLYAHSTVELADGLHEGFDEEDARRTGVVAAFPIVDHFDVQRQYDPSTGEPTNVIVEDRSDRQWYDRDYMRVDWSSNMVDGFRMFHGMLGGLSPVPDAAPQDDDEIDPHRTRINDDFIDTVSSYSYDPDIWACYGAYGLDSIFSCEGGQLSIRTSMQRVPEEETYEPKNYVDSELLYRDGEDKPLLTAPIFDPDVGTTVEVECNETVQDWMLHNDGDDYNDRCRPAYFEYQNRFGYFRTERVEWDRYVGTSDDQRRYYVNRWNIWQTMLDEDGNTLDPEERTPKPITFYKNLEYPEFMFDAAAETAAQWDELFRDTVKLAMDIDGDELDEILEDEYGHNEMFRIVQNSCHPEPLKDWYDEHGDHEDDRMSVSGIFDNYVGTTSADDDMVQALWDLTYESRENMCAEIEYATEARPSEDERFSWERVGDVRYSFFNWVEEDTGIWAGYGPSAADPKTGEIIRANANFHGKGVRQTATYAADVIQYFNNELSTSDILHGVQIRDDLFETDRDTERFGLEPEAQREMSMRAGVDPDEASSTGFEERPDINDLDSFVNRYGIDRIMAEADVAAAHAADRAAEDERMLEILEHPEVKNFLLSSPETSMAVEAHARGRHGPNYDDEQFHQAYLDMHSPRHFYERRQTGERLLSERNIMTHDEVAQATEMLVTYQGVADHFAGKSRDDIREHFLNELFIGTQLHEIGHAVGLRHNFSGHADALNYHDEFWAIEQAVVDGDIDREEAYSLQGERAAEVLGDDHEAVDHYASQPEYQLSTVMDYTFDLTGRFAGLGKYDRAAIKFAYGGMVEQWADDVEVPDRLGIRTMLADYTELPYVMAGTSNPDEFSTGVEIITDGREFVSIEDAKDDWRDAIVENTQRWEDYDLADEDADPPAVNRDISYEFCSDEFEGGLLDCAAFAHGGNQQEMVNHAFDTYRAFQTFWRHRRHNIDRNYDSLNTYMNRLFRTFQVTQEPFRYYSLFRWWDFGGYTDDLMRASIDGFNFYNEILAMPEPGRYCLFDEQMSDVDPAWFYDLENTYVPASMHAQDGECANFFDIERGEGFEYNYAYTSGREYEFRIDRIGSFIDKMAASQMLFDISADFAQSAFFTDFRASNISYWSTFKDEMLEMMSGVLLGDYQNFGATVNGDTFEYPQPVDPEGMGRFAEEDNSPRIYTPQSVNHQFNLMVGGLVQNSTWQDRATDFAHYVKVATSDDEAQEFGEDVDVVEFTHPISGQVYRAADIHDNAVGVRLIERANELGEQYEALDETIQEHEENGTMSPSDLAQLDTQLMRYEEQLQDTVARMDMSRFIMDVADVLR